MQIVNTTLKDLDFIYWLFEQAIEYQKIKGFPVWDGFDKQTIVNDITNKLQYKIVIEDKIACIFSICYEDSIIWREKEKQDAMYLHRIVVNPYMKGQKQFEKVLNWAKNHAYENNIKFLRMDTWGNNYNIIDYYKSFGFQFVENFTTPNSQDLPIQHRNLYLALLEYELK